jgi:uncharacterized protein HemY
MKEMIYLKGKESVAVGILLVLATIVFFVPIVLVVLLRLLFRMGQTVKEHSEVPAGVNTDIGKRF